MVFLFAVTVFLGAGLLFVVQPMAGKLLLPVLGGAPAVWNTCLVFFQGALLAGYTSAHVVATRLRWGAQVVTYLAVAIPGLAILPVRVDPGPVGSLAAVDAPVGWLLLRLVTALGLPFVVLSATAPLLQQWLSRASHRAAADPYVLYAASNLGSLLALVVYPLVIEPRLGLIQQGRWWVTGYALVVGLAAVCGMWAARSTSAERGPVSPAAPERLPRRRQLRWLVLALVPSSYLLGVTTFLSTDLAPVPLLWALPLALYLLSFVLVFAPRSLGPRRVVGRALPGLVLLVVLVSLSGMALPLGVMIFLHLSAFFVAALSCHGQLALDRPEPSQLTRYYLMVALGGVLGGGLNALVAPILFNGVAEYPLAMILACLLMPTVPAAARIRLPDLGLPATLGVLTVGLVLGASAFQLADGRTGVALMFALPAVLCYTFVERPVRFALGLAALLTAGQLYAGPQGRPLHQERTFFGVVRVTVDRAGRFHQLVHGSTVHGRQRLGGDAREEPLSYYHPSGPAGDVFARFRERGEAGAVAVVGLGTGSLCAYARPRDEWVFYEIDPAVERIARDPAYFTFWRDCRAERRSIVHGDARLSLAASPDRRFDLLVVDAFSSDAVPLHLVTREAVALYRRKITDDGWVAFHVSSRYLDLPPALAALARDAELVSYLRDDLILTPEERSLGKDPSRWVVMARSEADLGALADAGRWRHLGPAPRVRPWTDDFSNLWSVIRWE